MSFYKKKKDKEKEKEHHSDSVKCLSENVTAKSKDDAVNNNLKIRIDFSKLKSGIEEI
jgi:hypothetical protein